MTKREELIEAAAKAVEKVPYHAWHDVTREGAREIARAALAVFEQAYTPTGPAFIAIMPPSPETAKRWYSMYCRECGIEEMMTETADDPRLIARRDEHNRAVHTPTDDERTEWAATLEALLAEVYTILKPLAESGTHIERAADAAPESARRAIMAGEVEDQRMSLVARLANALEQAHTSHVKPFDTSPEPVKNGADSSHVTPTDDERAAARAYADAEYPEMKLAPENEDLADVAERAYLAGWTARRTVQGEPSDAIAVQSVARIIAAAACDWNHNDCGDDDHHLGHTNWGAYIDDARDAIAAATQEGENRG